MSTAYGVSFGKGSGQPTLANVKKAFGEVDDGGNYIAGSLPLVLCYFEQSINDVSGLSGVFTDYPTAASAPGTTGGSICLCFKTIGTPPTLTTADKNTYLPQFFQAMATYVADNPGAIVYWVYWQEPDGSSGVAGGNFAAAQFVTALEEVITIANANGCGVAGSATPNPYTQCMIKLEGETAISGAAAVNAYLPASGLAVLGFDSYGSQAGAPGNHTGYPVPPWQSLSAVITKILPSNDFTGYSGRSISDMVTNGTTLIASATAAFTASDVGAYVVAPGILPPGTQILVVNSALHAHVSVPAETTATGQAATIGALQWGLGEFGSTGLPNACTATPSPCAADGSGWSTTGLDSTGVAPIGSWYESVVQYLATINPPPVICNLFNSGGTNPAPGNNGSITCTSGPMDCTNLQPPWSYNTLLMPSAPRPAEAWQAIIQQGAPVVVSVYGPAELGAYRVT